ncbi:MAG: hypothetical protein WBA57_15115 [Elainellaceae cyanobacterium]
MLFVVISGVILPSVFIGSRAAIAAPVTRVVHSLSTEQDLELLKEGILKEGDRLFAQAAEVTDISDQQAQPKPLTSPQELPPQEPPEELSENLEESDEISANTDEIETLDSEPQLSEPQLKPEVEPETAADEAKQAADSDKPLKTYFLSLISNNPRQQIKLDPPATQIKVSVSGDINSVRCSDGVQTYNCIPGKPLIITHDGENPITEFWAQNSGGGTARISLEVYQ